MRILGVLLLLGCGGDYKLTIDHKADLDSFTVYMRVHAPSMRFAQVWAQRKTKDTSREDIFRYYSLLRGGEYVIDSIRAPRELGVYLAGISLRDENARNNWAVFTLSKKGLEVH